MKFKKENIIIGLILISSIVLSFILVNKFPPLPIISDSKDYNEIALGLIEKNTYITISDDKILYPPLYPIFLSIVYSLGLGISGVYIIQYLLIGAISIYVFYILRKLFNVSLLAGLMASLIILFWPYFILYSQLISSEILYSFLLMLFFIFFINTNSETKIIHLIATGAFLGLAILTRPVALLLLPWIFIALWLFKKMPSFFGEITIPWRKYLFIFATMILVISPWIIYVKIKYDRFIPVASNLSYVFKKANTSMGYLSPETSAPKDVSLAEAKARNIYLFWNPGATGYHLDILKEKYPIAQYAVSIYKIIFFILLGLALSGIFFQRKDRVILLSLIIILYFWALHTVLFPFPRYTLPIIPYVVIVAISTAYYGYNKLKKNIGSNPSS